jgi:hypothetical protein
MQGSSFYRFAQESLFCFSNEEMFSSTEKAIWNPPWGLLQVWCKEVKAVHICGINESTSLVFHKVFNRLVEKPPHMASHTIFSERM